MPSKLQGADIKNSTEIVSAGATIAQLPTDDQIYVSALSINKTLKNAIIDGDIGSGSIVCVSASNSVSTQTLPSGSYTKVSFDSVDIDTASAFASGSFTAPSAGYYRFSGYINMSPTTAVYSGSVYLLLNGATSIRFCNTDKCGTSSVYFNVPFDFLVQLSASDIIDTYAYQNSGASLTIRGNDAAQSITSLIIQKVK
jgi:hypothetical protein